mgnify:CR=1 FL=1|tara:strand:- start:274 stop:507 length:234 start_codon:yes stop_codon:yes gene_type:complete
MLKSNMALKLDENGKILYGSVDQELDINVDLNFFAEFRADYWVFNGTELELVPDAEALQEAAVAAEKAELESRESEA